MAWQLAGRKAKMLHGCAKLQFQSRKKVNTSLCSSSKRSSQVKKPGWVQLNSTVPQSTEAFSIYRQNWNTKLKHSHSTVEIRKRQERNICDQFILAVLPSYFTTSEISDFLWVGLLPYRLIKSRRQL